MSVQEMLTLLVSRLTMLTHSIALTLLFQMSFSIVYLAIIVATLASSVHCQSSPAPTPPPSGYGPACSNSQIGNTVGTCINWGVWYYAGNVTKLALVTAYSCCPVPAGFGYNGVQLTTDGKNQVCTYGTSQSAAGLGLSSNPLPPGPNYYTDDKCTKLFSAASRTFVASFASVAGFALAAFVLAAL